MCFVQCCSYIGCHLNKHTGELGQTDSFHNCDDHICHVLEDGACLWHTNGTRQHRSLLLMCLHCKLNMCTPYPCFSHLELDTGSRIASSESR